MACVWFLLLVALMTGQVFARDCALDKIKTCDQCIQCGYVWCNDPKEAKRCSTNSDDFCPRAREQINLSQIGSSNANIQLWSDFGSPVHVHQAVLIPDEAVNWLVVKGPFSDKPKFQTPTYANSSTADFNPESFHIKITQAAFEEQTKNYKYSVLGKPSNAFCPATQARELESVTYKLDASGEDAWITYHVPCACACSAKVERNSARCNGRGNYSCEVCACEPGWKGEFCNEEDVKVSNQGLVEDCGTGRGDIHSYCRSVDEKPICSNNGNCTCEGKCVCRTDIEGYQYFDQYCADICSVVSDCDSCIINPPTDTSYCKECRPLMNQYFHPINKTRLEDKDDKGRKVWIKCIEKGSDVTNNCDIEYAAMKTGEDFHIMVVDRCKKAGTDTYAGAEVNVMVPTVLGVIALVAAATAVAGYMVWKNRGPPLPFAHQDYGNIDAEDCTGENPLYKPPTSSFKNPTYGKW